jgi:pimeloyl-ACP methyl ester carboxylesterase
VNAGTRLPSTPDPMHTWHGLDGITIAGDSWGDSAAPLVVLLHGGGQTRHAWSGAGRRLAEAGYYAVALDARGHGDSDWAPDGVYSQDAQVADLVAVLHEIGKPHPVLAGASMGGGTSLVAIGENRVDAAALVLVDVAPRIEREGANKILDFMNQNPDGFESLEEVAEAIANYQPHRQRTRRLDGLAKNVRLGDDGRYHWHWDPATRYGSLDFEKREERLVACAKNLSLPTLLVRGGLSDVLSEEGAQGFLDLCPQSEYVNVTGAAHMVAGDRNDIFVNAVIDFLLRVVPLDGSQPTSKASITPPRVRPPNDIIDIP